MRTFSTSTAEGSGVTLHSLFSHGSSTSLFSFLPETFPVFFFLSHMIGYSAKNACVHEKGGPR